MRSIRSGKRSGLEKAEYSARGLLVYRDLHHEFVVPMEGYAEAATALVEEYLRGFAERAYKAIHPIPLTE